MTVLYSPRNRRIRYIEPSRNANFTLTGVRTSHANEILHLAGEHPAQRGLDSEMGRYRIEPALFDKDADGKCIIAIDRPRLATTTFVDELKDPWYGVSVETKQGRK